VQQISNQNPKQRSTLPPASPKLIRYFGNASLGTGLLLRPSHRGSAQADAADGFLADFDRNAAAERNDIRKHPLPGGSYAMDHSGVIYLMGRDGRFVTYYEEAIGPDKIAEDLRRRV